MTGGLVRVRVVDELDGLRVDAPAGKARRHRQQPHFPRFTSTPQGQLASQFALTLKVVSRGRFSVLSEKPTQYNRRNDLLFGSMPPVIVPTSKNTSNPVISGR